MTEDLVRSIFEKLSSDTPQDFFDHVSDAVSWDVLGTHPLAGHYSTKAAFQNATFERLGKLFDGPLRLYTRNVLFDGEWAAVELYAKATAKSGVPFHNEYCWICRFEGAVIVQVRAYLDSALVAQVIAKGNG